MSDYISRIDQSVTVDGAGTWTHLTKNTGMYFVGVELTEIPPSSISISITNNGTQIASFSSPAPAQSAINLQVIANVTAIGNPLAVTISSSNSQELQLNTIKSTITMRLGQ
jgi:hypothetical protein